MQTTLTLAVVIFVLASFLKPFAETRLPASGGLHDATIRAMVLAIGLVAAYVDYAVHARAVSGAGVLDALGTGLQASLIAIGTFHAATSSYFGDPGVATLGAVAPAVPLPAPGAIHAPTVQITAAAVPPAGYSAATLEPGILPPAV